MSLNLHDLQQIATRADLVQLRQEIAGLLRELEAKLQPKRDSASLRRDFYTPKEFGALVGVSRQTVARWAQDGTIAALQVGGKGTRLMVPHSELERLRAEAEDLKPQP